METPFISFDGVVAVKSRLTRRGNDDRRAVPCRAGPPRDITIVACVVLPRPTDNKTIHNRATETDDPDPARERERETETRANRSHGATQQEPLGVADAAGSGLFARATEGRGARIGGCRPFLGRRSYPAPAQGTGSRECSRSSCFLPHRNVRCTRSASTTILSS
jgi:hypothetical protein